MLPLSVIEVNAFVRAAMLGPAQALRQDRQHAADFVGAGIGAAR